MLVVGEFCDSVRKYLIASQVVVQGHPRIEL